LRIICDFGVGVGVGVGVVSKGVGFTLQYIGEGEEGRVCWRNVWGGVNWVG